MAFERFKTGWGMGAVLAALVVFAAAAQDVDPAPVAGDWEIALDAQGEIYYLLMNLEAVDGKLSGTVSEASGFFTDIPLVDITWDGERLGFGFTSPTPPDGMEREVVGTLTLDNDRMEGFITVDDLGVSAPAVATRR